MVTIELLKGNDMFRKVGEIIRVPLQRAGYQIVMYKGNRHMLLGGIRTPLFINIDHPLRGRVK